ncbi:MAG TPA: hypothetical protein VND93_04320, partial [Myxococcales bacterium]|nr:hypothetical protein [Myxococcales bacterium]
MAPVRQDASHRPVHVQGAAPPGALAPQATPATGPAARADAPRAVPDGFEAGKARTRRAGGGDAFETPAGLGPRQKRAYESLAPDQRSRFDQLAGAARADQAHPAKSLKQVQSLLGSDGGFKHYDLIDQALRSPGAQGGGRGEAPAELQRLLFSGRLTQGKSPLHQSALEHLGVLASQQRTATGLDSHRLLADTVLDLAHPERIQQGQGNHDCGGTAAAVILAKGKPAEYARVVTELGTKGTATAGDQVWTASQVKEKDGGGGRSLSQQLFAA